MPSITSANSSFTLVIPGLVPGPVRLQGYATDDAFSTAAVKPAEVMMGVDGKKSAGFVFVLFEQDITLQADSTSNDLFETWFNAQQQQHEVFDAQGTIVMSATGKVYQLANGTLTSYTPMPGAKKTLQPRQYQITWESVNGAPQ